MSSYGHEHNDRRSGGDSFRAHPVAEPTILYEDDELLAVNKPAGLLVHGTRNTKHETPRAGGKTFQVSSSRFHDKQEPTVVDWLLKNRPEVKSVGDPPSPSATGGQAILERPGIVHRLDRETSGVMVIAKTQAVFEQLKKLFGEREVKKTYLVVVRGRMRNEWGVIDRPIGIVSGSVRRSVHATKMAKEAVTEYRLIHHALLPDGEEASVLHVFPKTGRTHQIRVHLASLGHPIVGDRLYDKQSRTRNVPERMFLHAAAIEFDLGPGKRLVIEAPVPPELAPYLST